MRNQTAKSPPKYDLSTIKNDLNGGLVSAIISLPMGLAFGVQSGLGAEAGIYTSVVLAIVASLFGGTKTLISDPTGPMTVVAATIITLGISSKGDLESAIPLIFATFFLAGVIELIFGIIDIGRYIKYIPFPVVSSFMTGIGVLIISMQLFPLLGHTSPQAFIDIVTNIGDPINHVNLEAVTVGLLTLGLILLLPYISKKIPAVLTALIASTVVSIFLQLDIPVIGSISLGLPQFRLGQIASITASDLSIIIGPALILGGLGVIDSLLTSVVADRVTQTKHNSRKTIVGQGIGNIVVSLLGGIPGAGATMGTITNINAGGTTRLSGFFKGLFLVLIVTFVSSYVELIPLSVLAAILIYIGVQIIDTKGLTMMNKVPKQDSIVWGVVLLLTIFDNLLNAVAAGFILSCIFFIAKISKSMNVKVTQSTLEPYKREISKDHSVNDSVIIQNIDGPLFFGFTDRYKELSSNLDNAKHLVIRMENVPFLDQSGLVALDETLTNRKNDGVSIYITGANQEIRTLMEKTKMIPSTIDECNFFTDFDQCIHHLKKQNAA